MNKLVNRINLSYNLAMSERVDKATALRTAYNENAVFCANKILDEQIAFFEVERVTTQTDAINQGEAQRLEDARTSVVRMIKLYTVEQQVDIEFILELSDIPDYIAEFGSDETLLFEQAVDGLDYRQSRPPLAKAA